MGAEHSVNLTVPPGRCASPPSSFLLSASLASAVVVVLLVVVVVVVAVPVAIIGFCCATRVFVAEFMPVDTLEALEPWCGMGRSRGTCWMLVSSRAMVNY